MGTVIGRQLELSPERFARSGLDAYLERVHPDDRGERPLVAARARRTPGRRIRVLTRRKPES